MARPCFGEVGHVQRGVDATQDELVAVDRQDDRRLDRAALGCVGEVHRDALAPSLPVSKKNTRPVRANGVAADKSARSLTNPPKNKMRTTLLEACMGAAAGEFKWECICSRGVFAVVSGKHDVKARLV